MIQLWNDYYLDVDELNFIIKKRSIKSKGSNKGSEQFLPYGYHTNVFTLKRYLINQYTIDHIDNDNMNIFFDNLDEIISRINKECRRK